ncbi:MULTISPECIES: serine/threonine protein kinase [Gordonibacter]|uniref:non-specific serine/threonine protein kinase n=1 Tax=Gordonibacter faecis TaxID=3047475 RepID=A0ABT7DIQ4_9ACTN|nr:MULTISPECIES: serine/threonine-protein kinase [unclassified Gordonibacter]MDJ1649405.1 serine/threonine-protein kinase [Gordonibacter sp. KGMB12511]HIW75131.1 serine/threonine protein kinase [Candidatus Gordonibacter avicola]
MSDELAEHLDTLARDACYRTDVVLKSSPFETTERVYFKGENGAELGPFVRKAIDRDAGLGIAYERICAAQKAGRRFRYLPHIMDCYDVGGKLVVVMEYVGGETLAEVVYRCDPSIALACDVFPRLCDAVTELHEGFDVPLIHRDLKPSNIMLSRDSMTIIDFGIARAFKEDSDEDTRHFGTRAYAPPEQFGFGQTDVRSDVYALGMLLYFCLTEKTPDAKARKADFREEGLPEPFRAVIERAAAFDPADRFASASELKRAFCEAAATVVPDSAFLGTASAAYEVPRFASGASGSFNPTVQTTLTSTGGSDGEKPIVPSGRVKGSRVPRTVFGSFLARIPFPVGVIWDVALVLFFAFFCVAAFNSAINPSAESIQMGSTLWARLMAYGSIALLMIGPFLFTLSDRRPLVRLVPRFASVPVERDMAACLVIIIVGALLYALSGELVAQ